MLTRFLPSCLQSKLELAVSSHGLHRSESRASLQPVVSLECRHIGQKIAERVTVRSAAKKTIAMTCNRSIDLFLFIFFNYLLCSVFFCLFVFYKKMFGILSTKLIVVCLYQKLLLFFMVTRLVIGAIMTLVICISLCDFLLHILVDYLLLLKMALQ